MERFTLKLAGVPLTAETLYPSTRAYCKDYLCTETGKYTVQVSEADVAWERSHAAEEKTSAALPLAQASDQYLETLALYRKIVRVLLQENILLFHGAGIEERENGILFIAPSGTGKTTHIRYWQQTGPARVINGDKPLLKLDGDRVLLCGTPWQGKEHLGENASVPLRAIVQLTRGTENRIAPISLSEALSPLLQQSYRPDAVEELRQSLTILDGISRHVRLYRLACTMHPEAAIVARRRIFEEE